MTTQSLAAPLARTTSFFLDLLRITAALTVFALHVVFLWYPSHLTPLVVRGAERAVVIFFVLSGYVIAYSTLRKERDPRSYVLARLSRLYSVMLPALLLTAVLQVTGTALNPALYQIYDRGHDLLRYGIVACFLQSVWFNSSAPATNGPFWSLGYEFWYYAIFGAAIMIRKWRWKIGVIALLALACGPNIMLLMPNWLLGVGCYCLRDRFRIPRAAAVAALVVVLIAIGLSYPFLPNLPFPDFNVTLLFSAAFTSDAIFGVLVTLAIFLFDQAARDATLSAHLDAGVRWLADHTFSLYLYHFPLLFFFAAVVPFDRGSVPVATAMVLLVLGIILGLSVVTESRRPAWRRFFARTWDWLASCARSSRT